MQGNDMIINQPDGIMTRLSITNILWLALLGATWQQGWLQYIFEKDISYISHGIAILSAMVIVLSIWKGFRLSKMLSKPTELKHAYSVKREALHNRIADVKEIMESELVGYISFIQYFATTALAIGVLGTVIGLIIGFANVDPSLLSNVENAGATVANVLKGLSVAFHTTLVGGVANLWLRTNYYMLEQASAKVYATAIGR